MSRSVRVIVKPLQTVPADAIVFNATSIGAALLEGWSDGGDWRVLLPWPEELRQLSWDAADRWQRELAELEQTIPIDAGDAAPFLGGWVGFISYEALACGEAAQPRVAQPPEPPMFFARHRAGVVVSPHGEASLFAPEDQVEQYVRRLQQEEHGAASSRRERGDSNAPLHDSLADGAHKRAVEAIREAIRRGDVYQVNLTRAFSVKRPFDDAALYRSLTGAMPPRMSAFLRAPGCTIASASPEVLLRLDRVEGVAETRPIKGTVRRGGDDAREIASLLDSAKDAAEHLMIVDVSRNDFGKVAPPGQVSVSEYRTVRTLESVHHLESTIRATGLRDRSVADVLAALSPAASITGAPKRAAVQMIRALEPEARGVYCGAIGFIGSRFVELSVAIRTAIVTADAARYHAGGGIVWDSDAQAEDEESRVKSAAFLRYVGGAT
ncbi:MAG TPA: anthranilate synthase component I family protein [Thermoanaerobaculia bacterium]|nr:anthranilate synthase component I family protein [Thermoanaerobaculia bacterium]